LVRPDVSAAELAAMKPKGVILSGGPSSVYDAGAPTMDPKVLDLGVPVLGICYGMQLACRILGAEVSRADHREYGRAQMAVSNAAGIFDAVPDKTQVWMSHGDQITRLQAGGLEPIGATPTCPFAAVRSTDPARRFWGVQFHPEVTHTPHGVDMFRKIGRAHV